MLVAKGKKVQAFNLKKDRPSDAELVEAMTGPTGNLRTPTFVVGKTVVVGFNPEMYEEVL